jgi:hypothetical protein
VTGEYLGRLIGSKDGKPLLAVSKFCLNLDADTEHLGQLVAGKDGRPLVVVAPNRCAADGTLSNGKEYTGLLIGQRDGKPLIAVKCVECGGGGGDPFNCECVWPYTLNATVALGSGFDWLDPVDVVLEPVDSFIWRSSWQCLECETFENLDIFGFSYDTVEPENGTLVLDGGAREYEYTTRFWQSETFTPEGSPVDGNGSPSDFIVVFIATEYVLTVGTESAPTRPARACSLSWGLLYRGLTNDLIPVWDTGGWANLKCGATHDFNGLFPENGVRYTTTYGYRPGEETWTYTSGVTDVCCSRSSTYPGLESCQGPASEVPDPTLTISCDPVVLAWECMYVVTGSPDLGKQCSVMLYE